MTNPRVPRVTSRRPRTKSRLVACWRRDALRPRRAREPSGFQLSPCFPHPYSHDSFGTFGHARISQPIPSGVPWQSLFNRIGPCGARSGDLSVRRGGTVSLWAANLFAAVSFLSLSCMRVCREEVYWRKDEPFRLIIKLGYPPP